MAARPDEGKLVAALLLVTAATGLHGLAHDSRLAGEGSERTLAAHRHAGRTAGRGGGGSGAVTLAGVVGLMATATLNAAAGLLQSTRPAVALVLAVRSSPELDRRQPLRFCRRRP